jgi:hypothetical protein
MQHGFDNQFWMMQYQYMDDDTGLVYQGDKPGRVTVNWTQTREVQIGDVLVAYLRKKGNPNRNGFFAIGRVIEPRKKATSKSSLEAYVANKRSHDHKKGIIHYKDAPALYEDFDDTWRASFDRNFRYAQRIDVDRWEHIKGDGVPWFREMDLPVGAKTKALFGLKKPWFDRIKNALKQGEKGQLKPSKKPEASIRDACEVAYAKSQGFQIDSKLRRAIELYAMDKATKHFVSLGYDVEDTSKIKPYDLKCTKGSRTIFVEVKGTQSKGSDVFLTAGEVRHARKHPGQSALFISHSVVVTQDGVSGGDTIVRIPWNPSDQNLAPLTYRYTVE